MSTMTIIVGSIVQIYTVRFDFDWLTFSILITDLKIPSYITTVELELKSVRTCRNLKMLRIVSLINRYVHNVEVYYTVRFFKTPNQVSNLYNQFQELLFCILFYESGFL